MEIEPFDVFWIVFGFTLVALVILGIVEHRLHRRLRKEIRKSDKYYHTRLDNLEKRGSKDPEKTLHDLDTIARQFFQETQGISPTVSYDRRIEALKKHKDAGGASFCEHFEEAIYAGERVTPNKVAEMLRELRILVKEFDEKKMEEIAAESEKNSIIKKFKRAISSPKKNHSRVHPRRIANLTAPIPQTDLPNEKIRKKVRRSKVSAARLESIRSFDDLDRIRNKIDSKKRGLR